MSNDPFAPGVGVRPASECGPDEHEILLLSKGGSQDKEGVYYPWVKFKPHPNEQFNEVLSSPNGSRWALRYLGDD